MMTLDYISMKAANLSLSIIGHVLIIMVQPFLP